MARHVVPASILQNLIELALRSRLNLEELFSEAGIDPDIIGRPDALVDIAQIDTLFSTAYARSEDPWFGLHAGLANQYSSLDLVGRVMATSSTLGDAIRELLRFKDLLAPYLAFHFEVRGDDAVLACEPDDSVSFAQSRHHNDLVIATMVVVGRSLAGGDIGVRRLAFRHPQPEDTAEYRKAFGAVPMQFAMPRNEVHFAAAVLNRRLSTAYPQYHQRVERQAEQQLSRLVRGLSVSEQVCAQIESRLGEAPVGIDDIARLFNMTARTLQRRLRDEGVAFGDLRDGIRHRLACQALADGDAPMDALAQRLGFSDTANFYHAFRRWEGQTPGAWRKKARGTPGGLEVPH